jgi:hypothetical protein
VELLNGRRYVAEEETNVGVTASAGEQQGRTIVVFKFEQSSSLETNPGAAGRYPKSQSRLDRISLSWKLDTPGKVTAARVFRLQKRVCSDALKDDSA